jgi:DNA-binding IclR family transcriptional regulator
MEKNNPVQSLDRALTLVETLGGTGTGLSIAALSAKTALHKSTIHRLLAALKARGYVVQDEQGFYRLSFKVCLLARQVIDSVSIVKIAKPYLKQLCETSQETVHLVVRQGDSTVYMHREECLHTALRVVSTVGAYRPLHTSGTGKSILATLDDREVQEYWQRAEKKKITPHTITTLKDLMSDIKATRERDFAVDNEENTPGVRCIAIAIPDYQGQYDSAISIAGPKDRMTDAKMSELKPHMDQAREEIMAKTNGYSG